MGLALGEDMERRFLKRQKEKLTLERGSEGCLVLRHVIGNTRHSCRRVKAQN